VLLSAVLTFSAVTLLPPAKKQAIVSSRSGHYIGVLLERTRSLVPPEYCEVVKPYLDKFEERLGTETAPTQGNSSAPPTDDELSPPPAWDPPQTANRPAPPSY